MCTKRKEDKMKLFVLLITLHLALGASIFDVTCPDSCNCQVKNENYEITCSSYEFIKKLNPKQISKIVRLNINNASLRNIDVKLKYLKNLHYLDLSKNDITNMPSQFPYLPKLKELNLSKNDISSFVFSQLPKNLQVLDLASNHIKFFPKDWSYLKGLKLINFDNNPVDCDCNNILIYEQLLEDGIRFIKNLTCHYPKEYFGRPLTSINCSLIKENLLNSMLGDEAGSGLEDSEINNESDDQREFIKTEEVSEVVNDETLNEEGSGEEGSGFEIPITPIEACNFNCSTPKPIGDVDEKDASPPPDLKEQVGILFDDIFGSGQESTTEAAAPAEKEAEEPLVVKQSDKGKSESFSSNEVETFPTNDTKIGKEMERASLDRGSGQSTYIIVGLVIAFLVFLAIYFYNRRKNRSKRHQRKRRNKPTENGVGEEMKPLGKPLEAPQIMTKLPPNEAVPLINGKNGKISDDFKPQRIEDELDDVEIRKNDKQGLLTTPERVTIKASEIPDSIPKTPLLIHRQLNSDGEIVTTAVDSN